MADDNTILVEIQLEMEKLKEGLDQATAMSERTGAEIGEKIGAKIEGSFKRVGDTLSGIGAAFLGFFSFEKMIQASEKHEEAVHGLEVAMRSLGSYTPEAAKNMLEFSAALSDATGASENLILNGQKLLTNIGKLSGEQLKQATRAALDLSAATGKDLTTSFELLSRAANGNMAGFHRLGLEFESTGNNAADFQRVLAGVNAQFGGQAQEHVNTFGGAVSRLWNMFTRLAVSLGDIITQSPVMINLIKTAATWFQEASKAVDKLTSGGRDLFKEFTIGMMEMGHTIIDFVLQPIRYVTNAIDSLSTAFNFIHQGNFKLAKEALREVFDTHPVKVYVAELHASLTKAENRVQQAHRSIHNSTRNLSHVLTTELPPVWDQISKGFADAFSKSANAVKASSDEMSSMVTQGMSAMEHGIARSFASIGEALVKGQDVFKAFGSAILGVFADMLIQMGEGFAVMGATRMLAGDIAGGAALLAGGLAMVVAGGALKAIAGGSSGMPGGGSSANVPSTETVAAGGGVATTVSNPSMAQSQPSTSVNVNIAGNVLDRRQSGLEIVEVINEAFGTNGVKFATASV